MQIGLITSSIIQQCLTPFCDCIIIDFNDYKELVPRVDALLIELSDETQWLLAHIDNILLCCRDNNTKSLFWQNNNLTRHYLCDFHQGFDYLLTANIYEQASHHNICTFPYAINPQIHYDNEGHRTNTILFINRYSHVCEYLLKPILEWNTQIYGEGFLPPYSNYVMGNPLYTDLAAIMRKCNMALAINENGVCSRQVFELIASGVFVISNKSEAISLLFPEIPQVQDHKELKALIKFYLRKPHKINRILEIMKMRILEDHTYQKRMQYIESIVFG